MNKPPNIDGKFLAEFIEVQKQKAINDANSIDVKKHDLKLQAEYAKDSLAKQHDLLKCKPSEDRKTFALLSTLVIIVLGLFGYFILHLLKLGQKDMVELIFTWIARITIIGLTFWLGRLSKSDKNDAKDEIEEAVEV